MERVLERFAIGRTIEAFYSPGLTSSYYFNVDGSKWYAPVAVPAGIDIAAEIDFKLTIDSTVTGGSLCLIAYGEDDSVIESVSLYIVNTRPDTHFRREIQRHIQHQIPAARAERIHCFVVRIVGYAGWGVVHLDGKVVIKSLDSHMNFQTDHKLCPNSDCER